ncbi:MAG: M28 family peptidase [Bacteroidetes bacterium]|jgi:hypothetical protein|nr:M28 family peptidase [Bacteroidota bacterium]
MPANSEKLYSHVEFLTDLRPYRNYRNAESLEKVVGYLKNHLQQWGYEPKEQIWKAQGREYKNLIATYNLEKSKRLIVGAHYDVFGEMPGADDNASAVAGLLETARLLSELQPDLDYRVDFVAYCLEEPPFFGTDKMGSYIHAKSLNKNKIEVIGMICYEMIGYFSEEPGSQFYPDERLREIYPDTGDFIVVVGIEEYREFTEKVFTNMKLINEVDTQVICFPDKHGYASMSDQRSYWSFGYPALMINDTSFLRNHNYHKKTDTIDTLDFEKMAGVINGAYNAVVNF